MAVGRKCGTSCWSMSLRKLFGRGSDKELHIDSYDRTGTRLDPPGTVQGDWMQVTWSPAGDRFFAVMAHMVRPVAVEYFPEGGGRQIFPAEGVVTFGLDVPSDGIALGDEYSLTWSMQGLLASTNEFGLAPQGSPADIVRYGGNGSAATPFKQTGDLFHTTTMQLGDVIATANEVYVVADGAADSTASDPKWSGRPHLYRVETNKSLTDVGEVSARGGAVVAVP